MKSLSQHDPRRIGFAALVALVVLAIVVTVLSTVHWGERHYTAHLANTGGLRAGEDVQVAGVVVGRVRSITLGPQDVVVEFGVDSGVQLGRETTAAVRVGTLLGTHYLALDPQGSGDLLNDTIASDRTSVPYNLQDVIDSASGIAGKLDAPGIAQALTAVSDAMEGSRTEFGPALEGIAAASDVIASRSNQIGELLAAARGLVHDVNAGSGDLVQLLIQSTQVLDEIRTRRSEIHGLLVKTTALSDSVIRTVGTTDQELSHALSSVNVVLAMLRRQDRTLRSGISLLGPAVRYLANAFGDGPWLSGSIDSVVPDPLVCKQKGTC